MHALCPAKDDTEMQMNSISLADAYKAGENENGYFNMLIAENKLCWDMLSKKFQDISKEELAPQWTGEYTRNRGEPGLCKGLARYMEKYWFGVPVDWEGVCIQNGVVSSMEGLVHLLANPGDTVIVPGPCYSVFVVDWWVRTQTRLQAAETTVETNFEPTIDSLEAAYNNAVKNGSRVKALALIQPNNPTGRMLSKRCLEECMLWAYEKGIHIISDEIYAISIFEGNQMISMAGIWHELIAAKKHDQQWTHFLKNYCHITGGLAKDFGLSGFRIGIVYTYNEELRNAFSRIFGYLLQASTHSQYLMRKVFEDEVWLENFITVIRRRLTKCYKSVTGALKAADIPVFEGQGTLMLWADFRQYLPESSWKGEDQLWMELFTECKWLITRGQQYLCTEPGWFRVMFTSQEWISEDKISAPFDALKERLILWKQKRMYKSCPAPITLKSEESEETGAPTKIKNFSHFSLYEDDDLEDLEQTPDLIKAYSNTVDMEF